MLIKHRQLEFNTQKIRQKLLPHFKEKGLRFWDASDLTFYEPFALKVNSCSPGAVCLSKIWKKKIKEKKQAKNQKVSSQSNMPASPA